VRRPAVRHGERLQGLRGELPRRGPPEPADRGGAVGGELGARRRGGVGVEALLLTNEYPPNVYGGAGVHVEYLARELAKLIDVDVRSFGEQDSHEGSLLVRGYGV